MTMCVTYVTSVILIVLTFMAKCGARSKLSLWIDEDQIEAIIGHPMRLHIIYEGNVINYLTDSELEDSLPSVPSNVDTVNLTWEAGDEIFTYWFDVLKSRNQTILYNPLLSIPASGIIPEGPKIFQISIPCTGNGDGVAMLVLGLQIMDQNGKPIRGSPIKLKLRKQCHAFETTKLCSFPCEHGGRCNQIGECECTQGFHGEFCEIDMCRPSCENNGTCISPDMCLCLDSFYGKRCEKALCTKPCQNGGRCVQPGVLQPGICWCTSGFFGEACEYSYCKRPCRHDGLCTGPDKCHCKSGYSGDHCEKGADRTRRRVDTLKAEKRRQLCKRKREDIAKRCSKGKRCKSKQERISKRCLTQKEKRRKRCKRRQEKLTRRCLKQKEKRRKRCKKKQADVTQLCQKDKKNKVKSKQETLQDNAKKKQNINGNR